MTYVAVFLVGALAALLTVAGLVWWFGRSGGPVADEKVQTEETVVAVLKDEDGNVKERIEDDQD